MAVDRRVWLLASAAALTLAVAIFASVEQRPPTEIVPDATSYASLAESLASANGYRIDLSESPGEPAGSRYPPGVPFMLAPLVIFVSPSQAAVVLAVALVVAVWVATRKIGGDVPAAIAVLLLATSSDMRAGAGVVRADLPAALVVVLALIATVVGRYRLAGVLAGFAVWTRLALAPIVFGLRRPGLPWFLMMVAGLVLTKVTWGWGYRSGEAQWSLEYIWSADSLAIASDLGLPNVLAYPALMLGFSGSLLAPGLLASAAFGLWRRPERRFVLSIAGGSLVVYVPYYWQDTRFMFPFAALMTIYAAVGLARLAGLAFESDPAVHGPVSAINTVTDT